MGFIQWTKDMSVGSDVLDEHHQMIVDCINRLQPLLSEEEDADKVLSVLAKLEDFVLVHFSEEEQAMRKAGYPDWRAHKDLHDKMYDAVFELKSDVERGKRLAAQYLFDLINDWLIKHILGEDRKYMPFLEVPQAETASVWHRSNGRDV